MSEQPVIPTATLIAAIKRHYRLELADIAWLTLGADAAAWVARATATDGTAYFLKLRAGSLNAAGLLLPALLQAQGLPHILAPLPAADQRRWVTINGYTLILYPFIAGRAGADGGLTPAQWTAFGQLIRQIHSLPLPAELAGELQTESWTTDWAAQVQAITAAVHAQPPADDLGRRAAALLDAHAATIATLAARATALAIALQATPAPLVLCHADLHTWNVMVDEQAQLWLIDWDTAMLGRPERDLMFVVGGIGHGLVSAATTGWFFAGYGPCAIDPLALAYYRTAWAVQDIVSFSEQLLVQPSRGSVATERALTLLAGLFEPGEIVSIALEFRRRARSIDPVRHG